MYRVVSTPRTVAVPVFTTRVLDARRTSNSRPGSCCSSPSPNASSDSPLRTATHGLRGRQQKREAGGQAHVERRVDGAHLDPRTGGERGGVELDPAARVVVIERTLPAQGDVAPEDVARKLEGDPRAVGVDRLRGRCCDGVQLEDVFRAACGCEQRESQQRQHDETPAHTDSVPETLLQPEPASRPTEDWSRRGAMGNREPFDTEFFRSVGRIVEVRNHPAATLVGSRAAVVDAVAAALSPRSPRSVLLVGEQGVGKTTLVVEALRRQKQPWFAFQASAAEVHAGHAYVGELEGRVSEIVERMKRRSIVWLFPSFEEALFAGQHSRSPRGLLDAMLPAIEAREIAVVGEIDPMAYELLTQNRPRVTRIFEVIRLAAMTDEDALAVGRAWSHEYGADVDANTLAEALDLATHYLPGTAAPGNLLRLLELVLDRVTRGLAKRVTPETVIATLSAVTGLPLHVLDPRTPLRLDDVRAFFGSRVLGQPEAVDCLVDRIALVKAGLTDPTRPLGVFLFVGPTGTGKTEIAKAFSEFLFGSPGRLVRLDMSEYQTHESLERLLGDATEGANASPLISAVRKQPFTVLLLDEFEKAHESVWDVFLQVFDDGRLTDLKGRTVDLRHCVIILTSNLGSAIPRGPGLGFTGRSGTFDAASVTKSVERSFRPEFLNRLDRVVVFQPLGREIMRGLLEKELTDVLRRRGFRMQPWAVEWDEGAIDFLIEQGFSTELGARPLKRAVERYLLTRIATAIVERQFPEGDQFLFITARDETGLDVAFVDPYAGEPEPSPTEEHELEPAADPAERPRPPPLRTTRARASGHGGRGQFFSGALAEVVERVRAWDEPKQDALGETREHAFWQSPDRHGC